MNFVEAMSNESNKTFTENGAQALKSTQSALVDLFGTIGALRCKSEHEIISAFSKALAEDKELAMKMLFYARDIRQGLGERRVFRIIIQWLAENYPVTMKKNLIHIAEYGRWDDMLSLMQTALNVDAKILIAHQLEVDKLAEYPSLLAKWMPSINTSSDITRSMAKELARFMGISAKEYRCTLSSLRAKIDIVERKMTSGEWTDIEYAKVPSVAMNIYRKAFFKHDETGMLNYIESLKKGETKINASTLFPYNIVQKYRKGSYKIIDEILEAQWKALPNYVEGENNVLIMADTSGSMESNQGLPLSTSIGLAIYFAERNRGIFKDKFLTFSSHPQFVTLRGQTLREKMNNIKMIVENTDVEAAFKLILDSAVNNNIPQEDMPKALIIISDMQFDSATDTYGSDAWTFYSKMEAMYSNNGYTIPNVIFWNVDSKSDAFQVTSEYKGVQLASGQSVSVFKSVLANIGMTPYMAMEATVNSPRYEAITVATDENDALARMGIPF